MTSKRIGVLGGTFDPPHLGHVIVASDVCAALDLDTVVFVPAHQQPFKDSTGFASPEHRLAMCGLVADADERFSVSDVDLRRGGITYTVDTLTDLADANPGAELFFVAGADSIARLDDWREPERLLSLATFVGVARQGEPQPALEAPHRVVTTPLVGVSSTEVRRRVQARFPIRYLVTDAVADYIDENALYLGGSDV